MSRDGARTAEIGSRVRRLRKLNKRDHIPPNGTAWRQSGCPELLEGLRAKPVWWRGAAEDGAAPPDELKWLRDVEKAVPKIRAELLALRNSDDAHFQPYRSPGEGDASADALGKKSTDRGPVPGADIFSAAAPRPQRG